MNKELVEEQAQLYALGILPGSEREEFERRIREDSETRALVHEYQFLTELDAEAARIDPPFQVFSQVMETIEGAASLRKSKRTPLLAWSGWAAAACAAVALGASFFSGPGDLPASSDIVLNNLANPRLVAVKTPSESVTVEDRMLELAGLAEAYWFSREGIPSDQLLGPDGAEVAELSGGFTIYDRRFKIGFIAVENLPREAPDTSYHVWAKTSPTATPVRAGTLPIGEESRGLFFFDLSGLPSDASLDSLSFFVTEEESESPNQPSKMIVLSDV